MDKELKTYCRGCPSTYAGFESQKRGITYKIKDDEIISCECRMGYIDCPTLINAKEIIKTTNEVKEVKTILKEIILKLNTIKH